MQKWSTDREYQENLSNRPEFIPIFFRECFVLRDKVLNGIGKRSRLKGSDAYARVERKWLLSIAEV